MASAVWSANATPMSEERFDMGQEATASAGPSQRSWSNWFGNESCSPKRFEQPRTEAEVQELVAWASQRGLTVRVAGWGPSVTPVVVTDGVLLDLSQLEGGVRADPQSMTAKIAPGLRLEQLNGPLWE